MADESSNRYTVDRLARVDGQVRDLVRRAADRGIQAEVLDALTHVMDLLETRPAAWGDPLYNTHRPGGVVYHASYRMCNVHFAVYEPDHVVLILDILPAPSQSLDEG